MSAMRDEKINDYLRKVCFLVRNKKVHENIKEELYNHIDEIVEEYIAQDKPEEIAIDEALLHMGDPKTVGKNLNKVHKATPDWALLAMTAAFVLFGIFTIGFMERSNDINEYGPTNYLFKTIIFAVIGCILSVIILKIDYRIFKKYSKYVYTGTMIFFLLRFFLFGAGFRNGQGIYRNWITIGPVSINVLYVTLFLLILSLAGIYANYTWSNLNEIIKGITLGFGPYLLFIWVSAADTLAIYSIALITLMLISGLKVRYIAVSLSSLVVFFIHFIFTEPYRIARLTAFLNPSDDPLGSGYLYNQLITVKDSAKLIGHGSNYNPDILPGINTDYILSYILYTFGWIVAIVLIATVLAFIIRIGFIGINTKDNYGKLLVSGFCALFFGQFTLNILMNLAMAPTFSTSLPFISYGGSGLVINMISVGFITSVYRWRNSPYKIA